MKDEDSVIGYKILLRLVFTVRLNKSYPDTIGHANSLCLSPGRAEPIHKAKLSLNGLANGTYGKIPV